MTAAQELEIAHAFDPLTREYSGFIFDCDGTLVDSMPLHFEAWRRALSAHEAPFAFGWELFVKRAGKTLEVTVEELNQEFGSALDPNAVSSEQRRIYQSLLPSVREIKPVVDFARGVAGRFPLAVASGSDARTVVSTLELLQIRKLFRVIVTAEDVVHGKPAPDMFLLAAQRIGVPAEDCVVFEDSHLGIEAAERAHMGAVLVRRLRPPPVHGF